MHDQGGNYSIIKDIYIYIYTHNVRILSNTE